jgi:hypothetical protein
MITQSDNDAATRLWDEVGMSRLRRFLALARMDQTRLGQGGYWGLTQVTAHDEMLLLELLIRRDAVLCDASRRYQLGLMASVIAAQRWGTPAGAPRDVTTHVKNGWLPNGSGWHINSIGAFTAKADDYLIAVLTDANPSEEYGIDTIEAVALVVHRDIDAAVMGGGGVALANAARGARTLRAVSPGRYALALPRPTVMTSLTMAPALTFLPLLARPTPEPTPPTPRRVTPWAVVPALSMTTAH